MYKWWIEETEQMCTPYEYAVNNIIVRYLQCLQYFHSDIKIWGQYNSSRGPNLQMNCSVLTSAISTNIDYL